MDKQVAVGRFGSPFGIKGWIKVISYTNPIDKLLDYLPWYIIKNGSRITLSKVKGKIQGEQLIIQIAECQDRDVAKTFTNLEIFIDRDQLPATLEEEYYWVDLVGLAVLNCNEENLGTVIGLFETGANDVLVVKEENGKERFIPYIADVIVSVDLKNKKLTVDWDATF